MPKPLPILIRELLLACGALVLVAVGVWLFSSTVGQPPVSVPSSSLPYDRKTISPSQSELLDTDKDGLPDFEEKLWRTNPTSADTDGDGTSDGEEVSKNRNPNRAGPGDTLATPLTVVEQPSTLKETDTHKRVTPAEAGVQSFTVPEIPVVTIETSSENPLHLYGNAVGAFIIGAGADATAELAFLNRLAGNKKMNNELIQGLLKMAQKYNSLAKDITSVIPPEKAISVHKKLVETYQNYAGAVSLFADTPLGSYISATTTRTYSESTVALGRAVVAVSDLFYQERVSFGRNEPGAVFSFPR